MPHPIVEISELTQLVADHLLLDGQQGLISLACTCRALEEQALSTLWSKQSSLETLIKSTLPPNVLTPRPALRRDDTLLSEFQAGFQPTRRPPQPTRAEWDRFRRNASWMRRLRLEPRSNVPEQVLFMISSNLSNGILFPGLRDLSWTVQPHTLPFYRLFLSPNLTEFSFLYTPPHGADIPVEILPTITSMILELETFPLRTFHFFPHPPAQPCRSLESAVSSAVLRCGPSLEILFLSPPLSDAAVQHIVRLPNLTEWYAMSGPPRVSDLSLSNAFPQLDFLQLREEASLEWLPLFEATAKHTSSREDAHIRSHHGPCQKLTTLQCSVQVSVNTAFMAPIMLFHGLVYLLLESVCPTTGGCIFGLTDDDIEEIATALPRLREALFGWVCSANSCRTTVSSLVSFSTHCENLVNLEIHFNTTNLREDLDSISVDPRLDDSSSSSEREPLLLVLQDAPIKINGEEIGSVVAGFLRIFPSLEAFSGDTPILKELNARLMDKK